MSFSLYETYHEHVRDGALTPDPEQDALVRQLEALRQQLERARLPFWPVAWAQPAAQAGLYIYGPVGRGKSMLMDMFYDSITHLPKKRVHFHAFMLDVQRRLFEDRNSRKKSKEKGLALERVAAQLAREVRLLCFDEFQVYNIADAMILGSLFAALFKQGVAVVATSNVAPELLYKDGLQRALFLPFIDLIKTHLRIIALGTGKDYRQARLKGRKVYFWPLNEMAHEELEVLFSDLTGEAPFDAQEITLEGRVLEIPRAAKGVCWLSFTECCERPLGTADYLALARYFHTVLVEGVPFFDETKRDAALRFIHLVDVLYDQHANLMLSAAAPADQLYAPTHEFAPRLARMASRLAEMQSESYLLRGLPSAETISAPLMGHLPPLTGEHPISPSPLAGEGGEQQ